LKLLFYLQRKYTITSLQQFASIDLQPTAETAWQYFFVKEDEKKPGEELITESTWRYAMHFFERNAYDKYWPRICVSVVTNLSRSCACIPTG
jgi:hypothetical protein